MILCITDNAETDIALNKKSSRKPNMRHLINFIGFIAHEHHLIIQSRCVKRDLNWRADLLSKHQAQRFLSARPRRGPPGPPAVRANVAFAAAVETALSYGLSKSAQATRRAAWAQWIAFTDANDIRHGDFSDTTNAP